MHDHPHPAGKNLRFAFFVNFVFTFIEIAGGLWTGSVAILSDAVHDAGDCISLGLAWYLTFEFDLLYNGRLEGYTVAADQDDLVKQFEQLIGEPLERFEPRWRQSMLQLRPAR